MKLKLVATCHPERPRYCKGLCSSCYFKDYRKRPSWLSDRRTYNLKKNFGLTPEDYDRMYRAQGGLCDICKNPPKPNRALCVDHDHITGKNRGLLCDYCNSAIGFLKDDTQVLAAAIVYLEKHSTLSSGDVSSPPLTKGEIPLTC